MLTPRFEISEREDSLLIVIFAPFTNVAETEIFMNGRDFRFFSKPYFLRLHLPGEIVENDLAEAKYAAESRSFEVVAPKANKGEKFEGLQLLTELLRPKGEVNVRSGGGGVTVLEPDHGFGLDAPGEEDEEEIEWYFDQQVMPPEAESESESKSASSANNGYGFGFAESGVYSRLLEEAQEILDVKDPDSKTAAQRRKERLEKESGDFSDDHYLADLFESPDLIRELVSRDPKIESEFGEKERERLISLSGKREYLVDKRDLRSVFYGLIDILAAICYERRVNDRDYNPESGWTISKLSAVLSCNDKFDNLKDCLVSCMRRSLCYPLYRHFDLSLKALRDAIRVLKSGRVSVVKALIEVIPLMVESEGRYILNQLYIEPYAVWVQGINPVKLESLAEAAEKVLGELTKDDLDLDLTETERIAKLVLEEEQEENVIQNLDRVALNDSDDDSSSSSSSSSESDDESESGSESSSSESRK